MTEPLHLSKEQKATVEADFTARAVMQKLKPGTKAFAHAELEFFVGAMSALKSVGGYEYPADWVIKLMSGRSITGKGK
jgi:hypothetical protein